MAKAKAKKKQTQSELREAVQAELEQLREGNGGLLRAEDVVKFAENPATALHKKFTWDDTEAAEKYRLMQARQVIRVYVKVYPQQKQQVRAYVSLMDDRKKGGGYRAMGDVLASAEMRMQLLYQAHREMKNFISRYDHLEELAGVVAAMEGAMVVEPDAEAS